MIVEVLQAVDRGEKLRDVGQRNGKSYPRRQDEEWQGPALLPLSDPGRSHS